MSLVHTPNDDTVALSTQRLNSAFSPVILRSAMLRLREFASLTDALEAPLGKVVANCELVSGGRILARLIRRNGGPNEWLLVNPAGSR